MEKEQIESAVKAFGLEASSRLGDDNGVAAAFAQAQMLGEIAYQLAVMNERNALEDKRLEERVTAYSNLITTVEEKCDRLDKSRWSTKDGKCLALKTNGADGRHSEILVCGLPDGHEGKHGWDR